MRRRVLQRSGENSCAGLDFAAERDPPRSSQRLAAQPQQLQDESAPDVVKAYALARADVRLSWLASELERRELLLDRLSVADAYLFAVLNWSVVTPIDLSKWPAVASYMQRLHRRPAFARAFEEEKQLWIALRQRQGKPLPALG